MLIGRIFFITLAAIVFTGCTSSPSKSNTTNSDNSKNSIGTKSIVNMLADLSDDLPQCEPETTTAELKKSIETGNGKVIKETESRVTATFARGGFTQVMTYHVESGHCAVMQVED
jgi:hypothetical protein